MQGWELAIAIQTDSFNERLQMVFITLYTCRPQSISFYKILSDTV